MAKRLTLERRSSLITDEALLKTLFRIEFPILEYHGDDDGETIIDWPFAGADVEILRFGGDDDVLNERNSGKIRFWFIETEIVGGEVSINEKRRNIFLYLFFNFYFFK